MCPVARSGLLIVPIIVEESAVVDIDTPLGGGLAGGDLLETEAVVREPAVHPALTMKSRGIAIRERGCKPRLRPEQGRDEAESECLAVVRMVAHGRGCPFWGDPSPAEPVRFEPDASTQLSSIAIHL
jgi:hypothetical protein